MLGAFSETQKFQNLSTHGQSRFWATGNGAGKADSWIIRSQQGVLFPQVYGQFLEVTGWGEMGKRAFVG